MLNSTQNVDEEDVSCQLSEAFAEDTRSITWPPRSYTCSFCRREFRSAQALGGHMNVHRRDRAQLNHHRGLTQIQTQTQTRDCLQSFVFGSSSSGDPFLNWANDVGFGVVNSEELAFLYQLANNNHEMINNFEVMSSRCVVNDEIMQVNEIIPEIVSKKNEVEEPIEELDLELRLGHLHRNIR